MAVVNDKIIEVGLQPVRCPAFLDAPSAGSSRYTDAAHAARVTDAHQDVAIRSHRRLYDGRARPLMFPEHRAVRRCDTDRARAAQQYDLCDSIDGHQLWRAVTGAAGRDAPTRSAGGKIICGEAAGGRNNDQVLYRQRRAGEAPARKLG